MENDWKWNDNRNENEGKMTMKSSEIMKRRNDEKYNRHQWYHKYCMKENENDGVMACVGRKHGMWNENEIILNVSWKLMKNNENNGNGNVIVEISAM